MNEGVMNEGARSDGSFRARRQHSGFGRARCPPHRYAPERPPCVINPLSSFPNEVRLSPISCSRIWYERGGRDGDGSSEV